jgi:hypothetical protein
VQNQAAAAPAAGPAKRSQTPVWLLVGGIGCLGLILLSACSMLLLLMVGQALPWDDNNQVVETSAPVSAGGAAAYLPGDGPLAGGDVLLRDTFDNPFGSSLGEDEDASSRYAFEDGAYVIEVREAETLVWSLVNGSLQR